MRTASKRTRGWSLANPVEFYGSNRTLHAAPGTEDRVSDLHIFTDGESCVSCWELTDEEVAEIVRTRRAWLQVMSGVSQPPVLVSGLPLLQLPKIELDQVELRDE